MREAAMARLKIGHGVVDVLGGLPLFVTAPLCRSRRLRWGATDEEVRDAMLGDEIVPWASFTATRAITIGAPPELVWPWIVQMGYRRAGFYTYDLLDNAGFESADRILPQYQQLRTGDWMPMAAKVTDTTRVQGQGVQGQRVAAVTQTGQHLGVEADPPRRRPHPPDHRLKQRYRWDRPGSAMLSLVLLEFGDFPMMRRVLTGIKARAEQNAITSRTRQDQMEPYRRRCPPESEGQPR
jgi:hypothetical protein